MTKKRVNRRSTTKYIAKYKENLLESVIKSIQLSIITEKMDYFSYLRDPYALLLALKPIGVHKEVDSGADFPEILAKDYVLAVLNDEIDKIWSKMTTEEQDWCNFWADNRQEHNPIEILRTCALSWGLDWENIRRTWAFQPDPTAMAFGICAPRAAYERVTPVVGIPYVMIMPSDGSEVLRYPLVLDEVRNGYINIQIHKDGDLFKVFEMNAVHNEYVDGEEAEEIRLWEDVVNDLLDIPHTYVLEAFYNNLTHDLVIWDILCWNDIWLHERPLSERLKLLWHFHKYRNAPLIVDRQFQIPDDSKYIARNLNATYDPSRVDSHVFLGQPTILLKVGGRRGGGKRTYLNTIDGKSVFEVPFYVEKEDRGDVVEITRRGRVVKIHPKNTQADTWINVCMHFGIDPDYNKYTEYRMLPQAEWLE